MVLGARCNCGAGGLESSGVKDASPRFLVLGDYCSLSVQLLDLYASSSQAPHLSRECRIKPFGGGWQFGPWPGANGHGRLRSSRSSSRTTACICGPESSFSTSAGRKPQSSCYRPAASTPARLELIAFR